MSRRTNQNSTRFVQAMSNGRDRDQAMGVLIPHVTIKGDGTSVRGGKFGQANQVCTLPRRKPFNLRKGL